MHDTMKCTSEAEDMPYWIAFGEPIICEFEGDTLDHVHFNNEYGLMWGDNGSSYFY